MSQSSSLISTGKPPFWPPKRPRATAAGFLSRRVMRLQATAWSRLWPSQYRPSSVVEIFEQLADERVAHLVALRQPSRHIPPTPFPTPLPGGVRVRRAMAPKPQGVVESKQCQSNRKPAAASESETANWEGGAWRLQSLLPYPNSCLGASPHQQGRDTKMAMLSFGGLS
jgi:hypothetical protein